MNPKTIILSIILLVSTFLAVPGSYAAEDPGELAIVGKILDDHSLKLDRAAFRTTFADGTPVDSLRVEVHNDHYFAVRKGRNGASCRQEALPLWDENGRRLSITGYIEIGGKILARPAFVVIIDCKDVGCSDYVTPVGLPPVAVRARCEDPSSWSGVCPCRFPAVAGGELVPVINACEKEFEIRALNSLTAWIWGDYIQYL